MYRSAKLASWLRLSGNRKQAPHMGYQGTIQQHVGSQWQQGMTHPTWQGKHSTGQAQVVKQSIIGGRRYNIEVQNESKSGTVLLVFVSLPSSRVVLAIRARTDRTHGSRPDSKHKHTHTNITKETLLMYRQEWNTLYGFLQVGIFVP